MGETALAVDKSVTPKIIKISSKRQITIPADMHQCSGFSDYAFAVWNDDGSITISPIDVHDEKESVKILRTLLAQGLDGEELVNEYERIISPVVDFRSAIERSLKDIDDGRTAPFDEMQKRLEEKYGL